MKRILSALLAITFVFSLSACKDNAEDYSDYFTDTEVAVSDDTKTESTVATDCEHDYTAATCTAAKRCTKCGVAEGEALGHTFKDGKCTVCGATEDGYTQKYDVYVNEVGYSLNSEVIIEVVLKTDDTDVTVYPCVCVYKKSGDDWVPYKADLSKGEYACLYASKGDTLKTEDGVSYGVWDAMTNVNSADSKTKVETDFSSGRVIRRFTQTFKEKGEYKISVTDGKNNDQNEYKYNNALSIMVY